MAKGKKRVAVVVAPVFVNGVCVAREMARKGAYVVAVDTKPTATGFHSRYVKERVVLAGPEEFSKWLLSREDLDGAIVVPTDDFFVREIVENYETLSKRFKLAVSPGESARIALDKARAYEAAWEAGIPTPKTRILNPGDDFDEAAKYVGFPAILRPVFSIAFYREFGRKSFCAENVDEVRDDFAKASASGHKMLLQEVIPGEDGNVVSCKVYATDAGEIMSPVAGFKYAIYPPQFGVSQVQVARRAPEVEEGTVRILRHIGFRGSLASVEWKYDARDGVWKFLEINARSVLAIALMKFVGADVIDRLWRDKLGLPQPRQGRIRYGRRWAYLKNGLLLFRKHPEERRSVLEYAKLYRPPICFGLLTLGDMRPFLYDMAPLVSRRFARKGSKE
jgi:D-aspartate ligase